MGMYNKSSPLLLLLLVRRLGTVSSIANGGIDDATAGTLRHKYPCLCLL